MKYNLVKCILRPLCPSLHCRPVLNYISFCPQIPPYRKVMSRESLSSNFLSYTFMYECTCQPIIIHVHPPPPFNPLDV